MKIPDRINDIFSSDTARKGSLKGLLKPFKGKGELDLFADEIDQLRTELIQRQPLLIQSITACPVRYLPLLLCRNPARSGATFLRWRNLDNNRSGTPALKEILDDPMTSQPLRDMLLNIEHERVILNMQISVLTFILRQVRECREKLASLSSPEA